MTTLFADIVRTQRERGGLLIEARLVGDAPIGAAIERAVGASLGEMGRENVAGRLLSVVARGARITMHALITGARAAALAAERVYKGIEIQISLLGDEVSEISLVDRPLTKSRPHLETIAVLYKRNEADMSFTTAMHKYYGTRPSPGPAEVDAVWQKMTGTERAVISIKAALARPSSGGRNFLDWYADRALKGGGNPPRAGQF